jgi:hypothetical protein
MTQKPKQIQESHEGQLFCHRCGFRWFPKNPTKVPTVCARCKSPRWQTPRSISELETPTRQEQDALDNYLLVMRQGGTVARAVRLLVDEAAKKGAGG